MSGPVSSINRTNHHDIAVNIIESGVKHHNHNQTVGTIPKSNMKRVKLDTPNIQLHDHLLLLQQYIHRTFSNSVKTIMDYIKYSTVHIVTCVFHI